MKKALIAGCSHSTNLGLKKSEPAWFDYFAIDKNYTIHSIAVTASSLEYMIHKIIEQLYRNEYDIILFQLTTLDRYPIPVDGYQPFLGEPNLTDYTIDEEEGVVHATAWLYLQSISPNTDNAKWTFQHNVPQSTVKFLQEKAIYGRFTLAKLINNLYLLQLLCDKKGLKLVLIPHDSWNWSEEKVSSIWNIPNSSNIDKKYYIEKPFLEWLKENYNLEDYFLDKGFHLNAEGHKIFYYEYLKPSLDKFLL